MQKRGEGNPARLEGKLVENLVELQKVHTNMLEKFDKLSSQLSQLLSLFESAARTFATNPGSQINDKDREFLEKIDKLLEQNKTIAKGLTLMEEKAKEKINDNMHEVHETSIREFDNSEESYLGTQFPKF